MSRFVIVLVAVVATCSLVFGSRGNKCMRPWGKKNFEHEKFDGDWFIVGKINSAAVPKVASTCNKVSVTSKQDGNITKMDYHYTMKYKDGELKGVAKAQSIWGSGSVMLATWKKDEDDKQMATNYQDFAITYACRPIYIEETDTFEQFSVLHLLSRKPEMDSTLLAVIKSILGSFDFDVDEMVMVDHTDC